MGDCGSTSGLILTSPRVMVAFGWRGAMAFKTERIPDELQSVLDRRFLNLDDETRLRGLKTRETKKCYWTDGTTITLLLGSDRFLAQCAKNVSLIGVPLPGVFFYPSQPQELGSIILGSSRKSSISTLHFDNLPIQYTRNSSFLLNDMIIELRTQYGIIKSDVDIVFFAAPADQLSIRDAATDLEMLLIRILGPAIRREPLHAAA